MTPIKAVPVTGASAGLSGMPMGILHNAQIPDNARRDSDFATIIIRIDPFVGQTSLRQSPRFRKSFRSPSRPELRQTLHHLRKRTLPEHSFHHFPTAQLPRSQGAENRIGSGNPMHARSRSRR